MRETGSLEPSETQLRPSWDEYFMNIARLVATRSTCSRRQVGSVIVRGKYILATGYNGAPSGLAHCIDDESLCIRKRLNVPSGQRAELCRALHAEQNAIIQAAFHGVSTMDASIYVTHRPCLICAKMVINAGIKRVVYEGDYPDGLARELFEEAGMELLRLSQKEDSE